MERIWELVYNTIYGMVPFPMIFMTPKPDFKVTPLFDAEYLETVRDRDSCSGCMAY